MKNFQYIKDPGYMYDLFFVFSLKFNFEYYCSNAVNENKKDDDVTFYSSIKESFGNISDDSLPFFYVKSNGRSFMSTCYFTDCNQSFLSGYSLQTVQTALLDHEKVVHNVLEFYFPDEGADRLKEAMTSVKVISGLIKASEYSDALKTHLYAFFIDPTPYIQRLSYELMEKGYLLTQYYEKNYDIIVKLQNNMNEETILQQLKQSVNIDLSDYQSAYFSVCLISKNMIYTYLYIENAFITLGYDYSSYIESVLNKTIVPNIDEFGNAIAEKNRVDILDYLLDRCEASLKDIENEFGFSATNAYYHLSLLQKAKLITSRNQGRTALYSVNKDFFRVVCDALKKYYSTKEN